MRQSVSLSFLLIAIVAGGCAESHGTGGGTDSGPRSRSCTGDAGWAPFSCLPRSPDHTCGDVFYPAQCVDGEWQCPGSMVPESEVDCWCYGAPPPGCACAPGGWQCALDAGLIADAGTGCPADPSSAEGTPCAPDGTSCGRCTDSCGWCNLLSCQGGIWTRLEAFPPPEPCTSFDCGPELRCQAETQYCEHVLSDVAGWPDDYGCRPLPEGCTSCDCTPIPSACEQGSEGGLTITYGGG